ncbi:MAG: cupin domain-containing protein [Balneolaceae bacterium]
MSRKESLINQLNLQAHPEGGYFAETYRSDDTIPIRESGSPDYPEGRSYATSIYYLLTHEDVSNFHRLKSDEIWHHYEGSPATIHIIRPGGSYSALKLGTHVEKGQRYQHTVPGGVWFAVTVDDPDGFFLAGCTVAPGFDFKDFELADRRQMLDLFPEHEEIILRLYK